MSLYFLLRASQSRSCPRLLLRTCCVVALSPLELSLIRLVGLHHRVELVQHSKNFTEKNKIQIIQNINNTKINNDTLQYYYCFTFKCQKYCKNKENDKRISRNKVDYKDLHYLFLDLGQGGVVSSKRFGLIDELLAPCIAEEQRSLFPLSFLLLMPQLYAPSHLIEGLVLSSPALASFSCERSLGAWPRGRFAPPSSRRDGENGGANPRGRAPRLLL